MSFRRLTYAREAGPFLGLALLALIFQVMSDGKFISLNQLAGIAIVAAAVGTIGVGVTLLMISGEFDLSVAAVYPFAPIVFGMTISGLGVPDFVAFAIAMLVAAGVGLVNGLVTLRFRIPSFITTLGMLLFLTGLNYLLTGGYPVEYFDESILMSVLGGSVFGVVSMSFVWTIIMTVIFWFLLQHTRYGNWTFAVGGRQEVARAVGVPAQRVKLYNFVICSTLAGLAGLTALGHLRSVTAGFGQDLNLLAILAAVLGGTSLFGAVGTVWGTLIAAVILGSLQTGLVLVGAPGAWYTSFIGIILIVAVIGNGYVERINYRRDASA